MNRFANQIVPNTAPGATTELRNGGRTTTLGVEGSGEAMLGKLFDLGLALDVFARAGYLRATFDEGSLAGNLIPYAPSVTFSTGADVGLPMGLSAGCAFTYLGAHFTDDQNTLLPDVTGRVGRIDPAGTLDATLRYLHEPTGIGASVAVKNLLDHTDVVSPPPGGHLCRQREASHRRSILEPSVTLGLAGLRFLRELPSTDAFARVTLASRCEEE